MYLRTGDVVSHSMAVVKNHDFKIVFSAVSFSYYFRFPISTTNTTNRIVQILNPFYTSNLLQTFHVFTKYQEPPGFKFSTSSDVFVKVPGLTLATHHSQPMVYHLQFQGTCKLYSSGTHSFVRFLVDDRVLISNYLLPINDRRQVLAPELGDSNFLVDFPSGSMSYGAFTTVGMPCPSSDLIFLERGTHVIEVAAHFYPSEKLSIYGGELSVQMMQYQAGANITIPTPVIRG